MGVHYLFPPPEHKHVLGPLTGGQVTILAGSALLAIVAVTRPHAGAAGAAVTVALLAAVAAGTLIPVRGRVVTEWLPVAFGYGWARLRGHGDFRSPPRSGEPAGGLRLPAGVGAVEFLSHPSDGGELGVAADRAAGLYTAALELAGPSFLLEDTATQEQLLARWGVLLDRLAQSGSRVHRLQWVVRSAPDDPGALRDYARRARSHSLDEAAAVVRSYLALVEDCAAGSVRHQTLVVVQIAARGSTEAIRRAGGGDHGACTVLAGAVQSVADALADLGAQVRRPLSARAYQGMIRTAYDPQARAELDLLDRAGPRRGWGSDAPWPLATEERWGYYRTADRAWHRSYNLVLPLSELPADWFAPMLLVDDGICRTVSMTLRPVPRQQANREVGRALTRLRAEELRKDRLGQLPTAHDDKQEAAARQRMRELADGHAELVYAATATVTAPDLAALEQACRSVDQVAGLALCELRLLEGQQARGFAWTLPLARGLD